MDNTQILQETTHQNVKHCETNVDLVSYEGAIETSWQSQPAIELRYFTIDSYLACLAQVISMLWSFMGTYYLLYCHILRRNKH